MKINIIAILLCISSTTIGQSTSISKIIDSLQRKNIDTIIHYYKKCATYYGESNEFLLWRENKNTKFMTFTSNKYENNKSRYTVRTIIEDTIFVYVDNHFNKIKSDLIYPFIAKEQKGDTIVYSPMEPLHPCHVYFYFYIKGLLLPIGNYYRREDLEEQLFNEFENLNYKYNSSTRLFHLIKMVQKMTE